jgi:outer membrane lipoprotein SlyB
MLVGCAAPQTGDQFARQDVRVLQDVAYATIKSMRQVKVSGESSGQGASAGGAAGSIIGANSTSTSPNQGIAIVGGALLGSVFGGKAEEKLTSDVATEFVLTLMDGRVVALVQQMGADQFTVGQKVRLMSVNGQTRIAHE